MSPASADRELGTDNATGTLPQHGFASEFSFDGLIKHNHFLFRVHTPKEHSPFDDPTDAYFSGKSFKNETGTKAKDPEEPRKCAADQRRYEDVARHMDWTTRSSSPYITTSFSFAWAIWEAVRRHRVNVKHDVEIAVIDARKVNDRAVTALELLRKATGKQRDKNYWRWYRFALEAQDVLVFGEIPGEAIYASIPIVDIIPKLPSYFLSDGAPEVRSSNVFNRVAWDVNSRSNYRRFCQDMSARFLQLSVEQRMRESTAGAVRLAVCLLHPWFRATVPVNLTEATSTVRDLACAIARWPSDWWVRERSEVWEIITAMVEIAGEEISEGDRLRVRAEIERMRWLVRDIVINDNFADVDGSTLASSEHSETDVDSDREVATTSKHYSKSGKSRSPPTVLADTVVIAEEPSAPSSEVHNIEIEGTESKPPVEETAPRTAEVDKIVAPLDNGDEWVPSFARTSSWAVSTFLCGALVTLFMISSQRRELANRLT